MVDPYALYETMARIRSFETAASKLLAQTRIGGFLHLSIGQEAVAVGVCAALRRDDLISSTHRGHGHCIAKGGTVERMMAEMFGRESGYCKGRAGSLHIADPNAGILGANAIVGGGLPMGVGAALSAQVRGSDQVSAVFFGEGAVAEGVFHECLNLAGLWRLPVVFVCEHNSWAEMTPVTTHLAAPDVEEFAVPYRIASEVADGNDVLVVHDAASRAVARARAGEGPTLLVCRTYRWRGHFEGDPATYRDPDELAAWQERDPLRALREVLVAEDTSAAARLDALDAEAERAVQRAVEAAEAEPPAPVGTVVEDVYRAPLAIHGGAHA
ncbi:MAG: ABC transporter substrate-binding protein [Propionibacteriales bacterium]|nr:ABC transporter substrate-binding protein [Propionibacteriales bacterium]